MVPTSLAPSHNNPYPEPRSNAFSNRNLATRALKAKYASRFVGGSANQHGVENRFKRHCGRLHAHGLDGFIREPLRESVWS